jgi:predicted DNA-binding transcriptional regulator AlpA
MAHTSDNDSDVFLSKREVAELIGMRPHTVDRMRKDPECDLPPPYWPNRQSPRWSRAEILTWMRSRPRGGVSPNATAKNLGKHLRSANAKRRKGDAS